MYVLAFDAAAHMVEEVANAGRAVPLAIVWSYVGNATAAFVVISVTMWSIPDVSAALNPDSNPTGFAFIYPLNQAGHIWAQAIVTIIALIAFAGCTGCNAAASREMAAFARDGGLPGSQWLAKVRARYYLRSSIHHTHANMYSKHRSTSQLTHLETPSTSLAPSP